jgi:hypothetical protein
MRKVSKALLAEVAQYRPEGYVADVRSFAQSEDARYLYLLSKDFNKLRDKYTPEKGPGTELKKLLKLIGISATPVCQCNKRAQYMDLMGCDWCEENGETICDWLEEEASKRKLPFLRTPARLLIRRAIRNARAIAKKENADG